MGVKYKLSGDELVYAAASAGATGVFAVNNGWMRYNEQQLQAERAKVIERLCAAEYAELDFELNLAFDAELTRLAHIVGSCSAAISFDARLGEDDAQHTVFYQKNDEYCSVDTDAAGECVVTGCSLEDVVNFAAEFSDVPKDENTSREPMSVSTLLFGELSDTGDAQAFIDASGLGKRAEELSDAILSAESLRVVTVFFKSDEGPATAELAWLVLASGAYRFEVDYSTGDEVAVFTPISRDDRKKLTTEIVYRYIGGEKQ